MKFPKNMNQIIDLDTFMRPAKGYGNISPELSALYMSDGQDSDEKYGSRKLG